MALTPFIRTASYITRSIIGLPALAIQTAQEYIRSVIQPGADIQAAQYIVRAIVFSWPGNPKVRAWAYSQDGHDFYVLHLGAQGTIIYDTTTGSWSTWDSLNNGSSLTWRAGYGLDWIGMSAANYFNGAATQIVAGDEQKGVLWTLDPTKGVDDDPVEEGVISAFIRTVRGGYPITERNNLRVGGLWLRISTGAPIDGVDTQITLRSSDDQGATWTDHGSVTVDTGAYGQTIFWRSLGLIRPPIRIFEFTDFGAAVRIDGADIEAK